MRYRWHYLHFTDKEMRPRQVKCLTQGYIHLFRARGRAFKPLSVSKAHVVFPLIVSNFLDAVF